MGRCFAVNKIERKRGAVCICVVYFCHDGPVERAIAVVS